MVEIASGYEWEVRRRKVAIGGLQFVGTEGLVVVCCSRIDLGGSDCHPIMVAKCRERGCNLLLMGRL